jgi:intracellular sulfur oxidation DsrE/DsrF family protein
MRIFGFLIIVCLAIVAVPVEPFAQTKPDDTRALNGVSTGKVVWDISMANPETLALYLSVVRETYDDLVRQNVKPDMVLAIHGLPVRYVRKDVSDLPFEAMPHIETINEVLDDLKGRPGVRIEVCSVANRLMGVENGSIRDGLQVVGNTWVSLIGYQAQGYAVIPIQ